MRNSPDVVDGFRMRGREVTRLESFADAIFAFALTLLDRFAGSAKEFCRSRSARCVAFLLSPFAS